MQCILHRALALLAACAIGVATHAAPIVPRTDAEVIETLPTGGAERAELRRLRRALAADPRDATAAVRLAERLMEQAHATGDPRAAGQALAALQPWADPATAPGDVLLMQAGVRQYLHEFDSAIALLEQLLARDAPPPQAWLTLATLHRVQGRYAQSDAACRPLQRAAPLHASACLAENEALRGGSDAARRQFLGLLAQPRLDDGTRNWLLTSLAELEQRAGRAGAADAAFKAALAAQPAAYTLIAYADFLIDQQRPRDALALLRGQPRNDAVLLRLAIAGRQAGAAQAAADAREMGERIAQANLRPRAQRAHAREQALFALWVEADAPRALDLARANLRQQREPIDLLLLARTARAAAAPAALREAETLRAQMGLQDRRLDDVR
jgi:hypothetical protein